VIYLHGNASSQVEGTFLTSILCPQGIGVLCIDTNGCGRSDGATISLGYHERADVAAALSYLRTSHRIGPIALWGRSMGAAIALWCAIDQMDIQAIIVDSGYRSIRRIAADHVGTSLIVAGIVRLAFPILDRYVRKYGGFSMDDVNVGDLAKAKVPALFVHGHGDSLIYPAQTREIFALYGGKQKYFATANGEHCSNRPGDVRAIELAFLLNVFAIEGDPHTDIGEGEADDHGAEHFENVYRMLRKMR
jgi:pimeloyl-ACP methyl ester carboxylesterase